MSRFMQVLEGDFAQFYNLRKKRSGAFWGERYHAGMIQNGRHLWRCMAYVDLNMVRAGVVGHPMEWEWTGYNELMGHRRRNRLIDAGALLRALEADGECALDRFREQYRGLIEGALEQGEQQRQGKWTEAIAVGDEAWVKDVGKRMGVYRGQVFTFHIEPHAYVVRSPPSWPPGNQRVAGLVAEGVNWPHRCLDRYPDHCHLDRYPDRSPDLRRERSGQGSGRGWKLTTIETRIATKMGGDALSPSD